MGTSSKDFEIDVSAVKPHKEELKPSRFAMFRSKVGNLKDKVASATVNLKDKMKEFDIDNI